MSEKEKEAVDMAKKYINILLIHDIKEDRYYDIHNLKILLNLIDKQQKEIEELKDINGKNWFKYTITGGSEYKGIKMISMPEEDLLKNYISVDKIREKIKELEKEKEEKEKYGLDCTLIYEHEIDTNAIIRVLQELLGEEDE